MRRGRQPLVLAVALLLLACATSTNCFSFQASQPAAQTPQLTRALGTIKDVQADSMTLSPDSGHQIAVSFGANTKILRVEPGQTDLKSATSLQPQDLRSGDRVLVRGQGSADGQSIAAVSVIVMKHADLVAKQEHDRDDWERHGVGGLVTSVDSGTRTIVINAGGLGTNRSLTVHLSHTTLIRRYAPDSVKFEDAQPSSLDQIKPGDQLRARGAVSADNKEVAAEEIVFGSFRNVAGTVTSVDPPDHSLTVQDAIAKTPVVVKISPDSDMKKLPAEMAQRIAMRLKFAARGGSAGIGAAPQAVPENQQSGEGAPRKWSGAAGGRGNGAPDFQRFLTRIPNCSLTDLQKGDAVMIVSTMGNDKVTAVTLLAGVEPILTAASNRASSLVLSPWTLTNSAAEGDAGP